jgi:hypothetical protein
MEYGIRVALIGIVATALIDAWALIRRTLFDSALPNYRHVGRWIGHFPYGRLRHDRIADAPAVARELSIGWLAHYLIGMAFASLVPALWGVAWLDHPTFAPALLVGIGSVAAPFLLMQPAMGAGIAASRSPAPTAARLQSLLTHTLFGVALFVAARVAALLSFSTV